MKNNKIIARFQTWRDGERYFANKIFTDSATAEADKIKNKNQITGGLLFDTTYKEFASEIEANEWLQKMKDEA
jgi:hypothetical protein